MSSRDAYAPCLTCRAPTLTATGICKPCRDRSGIGRCKGAGCQARPRKPNLDYCADCRRKRANSEGFRSNEAFLYA